MGSVPARFIKTIGKTIERLLKLVAVVEKEIDTSNSFNKIKSEAITSAFGALIGKKVFFVMNDKIVCGVVTGHDWHNLFVDDKYSLSGDKQFFFCKEHLLDSLSNESSATVSAENAKK